MRRFIRTVLVVGIAANGSCRSAARDAVDFSPPERPDPKAALFAGITGRSLGPPAVSGRVTDLAAVEGDPRVLFVAAASGGVWKTTDGGLTFRPVFDAADAPTASVGAVEVAPSDPSVVWVGTGEANLRNSVLPGAGVYRSTDGGETWSFRGLRETRHIGRIVVHPGDPDIAYVAALGHAWKWNAERGLFRTRDGGATWEKVLYIDDQHGAIDVAMDPSNPDVLYAALYRVQRDAFSGGNGNPVIETGPHAGIYKTVDGGDSWTRLRDGLPTSQMGRIGLSVSRTNPDVVYAVIQTEKTARSPNGQPAGDTLDVEYGGVFRSDDAGRSWQKMNDLVPRPFYYGKVRVDPNDHRRVFCLGVVLSLSEDGGRTFKSTGRSGVDQHDLWIDPSDSRLVYLGNDNGLAVSRDAGATFQPLRNLPVIQFYAIAADMRRPYHIYGGAQDNQTWGGPSANYTTLGVTAGEWQRVGPYDGMYPGVDPEDWTIVYVSSQLGNLRRRTVGPNSDEGLRITPTPPQGAPRYRFNWTAPLIISPHRAQTLYYAGNHVFKSVDRGDTWEVLGPDLTRREPRSRVLGNTITTIAESTLRRGLLYAGTDDGKVWVTRDDGRSWTDLSEKLPVASPDRWITRVEPSHHHEGTVYLTLSRMRNGDDRPYVFASADYGATWRALDAQLPSFGQAHVIRESSRNPDLLFLGLDHGLYASLDRGAKWYRMEQVPTASVHDLLIHPRDRDLIVATHGRGLYILDISPLEEATPAVLEAPLHLFAVRPAVATELEHRDPPSGLQRLVAENPPFGAVIHYSLATPQSAPPRLPVFDADDNRIAILQGSGAAGLQHVVWNLRPDSGGDLVAPGEYRVVLEAAGMARSVSVVVEAAPVAEDD